jgi:hypothetical protein
MAWYLITRRNIKVPRGFGVWMLFLVWMLASIVVLNIHPHDARAEHGSSRYISFAFRALSYLSATIILLYIGNVSEKALPSRRIVQGLAFLFIVTTIGGFAGIVAPSFSFTSPFELMLPGSLRANSFVHDLVHPGFSQVQDVLGYSAGRPKAPFEYTNEWGGNLGFFLPFFALVWLVYARGRKRLIGVAILVASVIPIVYSLNRGLWIAVGVAIVYTVWRLGLRGKFWAVWAMVGGLLVATLLFLASPLHGLVTDRLAHPHSNQRRSYLVQEAVSGALSSPVIGWGTPRPSIGSNQSISVGPSKSCPQCGTPAIGTHGQLWLVLYCNGFIGAALFVWFFISAFWHYRRNATPVGIAATLVILMWMVFLFIYNGLPSPIQFVMIAIALLWRMDLAREQAEREAATIEPAPVPAGTVALRNSSRPTRRPQPRRSLPPARLPGAARR